MLTSDIALVCQQGRALTQRRPFRMRKADLDENQSQPRIMMSWRQEAGMYKAVPENVARR